MPLCYAAQHGHYDIVEILLDFFKDKNYVDDYTVAFNLACQNRYINIAKLLKFNFPEIDHTQTYTTDIDILEWLENDCRNPYHHIKKAI